MIRLDGATVLLQWATGGLLFLWVTTRHRQVGIGYGWLLRGTYAVMAAGSIAAAALIGFVPGRDVAAGLVTVATLGALAVSVTRRKAGVAGEREREEARITRVAKMTGVDRAPTDPDREVREFPPGLDLIAPAVGAIGLVFAAADAGGPVALALARTLVGAAFLGAVSDAMLLGHWYLVQPGLMRRPLLELVRGVGWLWPLEVGLLLIPTGMVSAIRGTVDDGAGGLLTWFWVTCAITTIGLVIVTRAALRERYYSAVMAATGLLYLAILTAFGTDLVARAVLAG